jgi:hypothetical protein
MAAMRCAWSVVPNDLQVRAQHLRRLPERLGATLAVDLRLVSGGVAGATSSSLHAALWKTLQKWQSQAGRGDSPRTILSELA